MRGQLEEALGKEFCKQWKITEDVLERVLRESFFADRYQTSQQFTTDQEELQNKVDEAFAWYDNTDVEAYLQKVRLLPLMVYTGEWADGTWAVSYTHLRMFRRMLSGSQEPDRSIRKTGSRREESDRTGLLA